MVLNNSENKISDTGVPVNLSRGGQRRNLAYPFQVADDAVHMDVHHTLYPFKTTKKMPVLRQQYQKMHFVGSNA